MLKICNQSWNRVIIRRLYTTQTSAKEINATKSFQHTLLLPKTDFPSHLKASEIIERDQRILKEARFFDLYAWQRKHVKGPEFVLHDGPPYANGKPHIGHAINKILKDVIIRSQLIQGKRVHFIPGWDCHGLPIEMIALQHDSNMTPAQIRKKAKEIAYTSSEIQKKAFKSWGILGDWDNQCYYTYDVKYIINQLQIFWKLCERGLIYHDLKPVYWSPSSKTALAEAELVYMNHISDALTVRLETTQQYNSEPIYLLVWTTTPWTLPLNQAVYYSKKFQYSLIRIPSFSGLYIIASDLISDLQQKLGCKITIHSNLSSEMIHNIHYRQPWNKEHILKVFESPHVTGSGTGLLHSVPAHGHDDFIMSLENKLKVECFVDENGCYTSGAGTQLAGLDVLNKGSETVIQSMSKDIILKEKYNHKYPYDGRMNKPVIIRASHQWFIDTDQIKKKAIESLNEVDESSKFFTDLLSRPYWCLSRQRSWGVPIPVFFHKKSNRLLTSKSLIHHLCRLFEKFGPEIWWSGEIEQLFPDKICEELFVKREDITKGNDIMDIWFDSGTSWSYVLNGKKSDLYVEGVDQYTGWFQSSLLTSAGVGNGAPFKKILTHTFAVDNNGKKMSKSLGNVVDPESVLIGENASGIDTLRWWATNRSHSKAAPISDNVLKSNAENIKKIRLTFNFLLGALNNVLPEDIDDCTELKTLDRYTLNSCYNFYYSIIDSYNSYKTHNVCYNIVSFISNQVSKRYISIVKNKLYSDEKNSSRRKAYLFTLNGILRTLCHAVAPILPHMAEEVFSYHPVYSQNKFFYSKKFWNPPESWKSDATNEKIMSLIEDLKKDFGDKNRSKMSCEITIDAENFELLKDLQDGNEKSIDSELTEMFGVADVQLKIGERNVILTPTSKYMCNRCRRHTAPVENNLCKKCENIISNLKLFREYTS